MAELKYGEKAIVEAKLEPWPNPYPDRNYTIEITFPEFTCLCPRSGYPDFATIRIKYIPDKYIVELKSLKLYLNKYRSQYISHEEATNRIYTDLYNILKPRFLEVIGDFNPRGNVKTIVKVSSREETN
jgi:7-cyano-7-deazaguanine reductase